MDIGKLRELAKKATPGPWHVHTTTVAGKEYYVNGVGSPDGVATKHNHQTSSVSDFVCQPAHGHSTDRTQEAGKNMEFIASANPETVLKLLDALEVMGEALSKIAVPRSHVTDGSDTKEEYEELYDFWHAASSEKLDAAQKVLNRAKEILK